MTIALPIRRRIGQRWKIVNYRFIVTRPILKLPPSCRHAGGMPAYATRRTFRECMPRIRYSSGLDYRKIEKEKPKKNIRGETRCVWGH